MKTSVYRAHTISECLIKARKELSECSSFSQLRMQTRLADHFDKPVKPFFDSLAKHLRTLWLCSVCNMTWRGVHANIGQCSEIHWHRNRFALILSKNWSLCSNKGNGKRKNLLQSWVEQTLRNVLSHNIFTRSVWIDCFLILFWNFKFQFSADFTTSFLDNRMFGLAVLQNP